MRLSKNNKNAVESTSAAGPSRVGSAVYVVIGLAIGCLLPILGMVGSDYLSGGGSSSGGGGTSGGGVSGEQRLIELNNRAVATMYHLDRKTDVPQALAMFEEILREFPDAVEVQVNRAIAQLNVEQDEAEPNAMAMLQEVLARHPKHLRANYTLALLKRHAGEYDEALKLALLAANGDPTDVYATYLVGLLRSEGIGANETEETTKVRLQEARTWLEKAIALNPSMRSSFATLGQVLQQLGETEQAAAMREESQRVGEGKHQMAVFRGVDSTRYRYTLLGPKAEVIPLESKPAMPMPPNTGRLIMPAEPLRVTGRVQWRTFEPGDADAPTVSVIDLDSDGLQDLFIAGGGADPPNIVLRHDTGNEFRADRDHPLAKVAGTRAAVWGDFDNDELVDCYLVCGGGNKLFRQVEAGRWEDVTEASGAAGEGEIVDAIAFDADHDGDLDLYLVRRDGKNILLSNNLDGTFRDVTEQAGVGGDGRPSVAAVVADFDGDRDADIVIIHDAAPNEIFYNDLLWKFTPANQPSDWRAAKIDAAVAADVDLDGMVELYTLQQGELCRWSFAAGGIWKKDTLAPQAPGQRSGRQRLALADLDADGVPEAFAGGPDAWQSFALYPEQATVDSADNKNFAAWSLINVEPTHGPSIIGLTSGGPPVHWIGGPAQHMFGVVTLDGHLTPIWQSKSNSSGIGAAVTAQIGTRRVGSTSYRLQSGPGQGLDPVLLGLGSDLAADFVTVIWSSGVRQSEPRLECGEIRKIVEENRLSTSCPLVLVWDGNSYQFVADILGTGGLGYFLEPGKFATPDPTESLLLPPGLAQPREGAYEVEVAEVGEESTYLDQLKLAVYDLPPGWHVTVDERLGFAEPLPTGAAWYFRDSALPAQAMNDRGEDVLSQLSLADRRAAPPGERDTRFIGRTETHAIELSFEQPLDAHAGRPLLLVDAWIEFPFSSTLFAAWQAKADFQAPTIEARAPGGAWQVVVERIGLPDGMPRHFALPLDRLPRGATELRISTNYEIYWDALSVGWAEDCPLARRKECPLERAELRLVGIPERTLSDQKAPQFDFHKAEKRPICARQLGYYTRFGDVEELLRDADSALVVMGPGELVTARFTAPTGQPPAGWTRRLILESTGWCKDMDPYTESGRSIEPLPVWGTPDADALRHRDQLHRRYNTRLDGDL